MGRSVTSISLAINTHLIIFVLSVNVKCVFLIPLQIPLQLSDGLRMEKSLSSSDKWFNLIQDY